jgi:UDP-N-acetylmuramoyl-L-alanyl-D-glutamate--2,6-diaminopimelate ligase
MDKSADYIVKDLTDLFEEGTKFALQADKRDLEIKCNIPGRFSVMNAMQSCACAIELGIDDNTIKRSFESIKNVKGRLEKIELFEGRGFAVYIDYAHTPDAISKLLDTAASFKKKEQRVVLLFGCGGDREKQKRKIMGNIAVNKADFVIITSDNPRNEEPIEIIDDILLGVGDNDNFTVIPDRRTAIEYAIANAEMGDIILLAGKGHESYEINSKGSVPFDEREILFEIDKNYKEE